MPSPESSAPSESHYRQIVTSAIDYAIITFSDDASVTSWNLGAERLLGWSAQEMIGGRIDRIFTPEDVAGGAVEAELERARQAHCSIDNRWHLRKDGGRFWASGETMPLVDEAGRRAGFVKIMRDLTRVRQHTQDLQFLADASQALADATDERTAMGRVATIAVRDFADLCIVDLLDAPGRMRRVALAHRHPGEMARLQGVEGLFPDGVGPLDHLALQVAGGPGLRVGDMQPAEIERLVPDASAREALLALGLRSCLAVPLSAQGESLGALLLASCNSGRRYTPEDLALACDLGRRAAVAIQNARLLQALREADRSKDVFMATLAHELRNPLAPIANGLSIIERAPGDTARVVQVAGMIDRQVRQMTRLVDELLDVSRIAAGKMELKSEVTSLLPILAAAVEMSRPHIEAAQHQLVLSFTNEPTQLLADPARLAQVFTNLLNNAAKYTRPGGRIEVVAEALPTELVVRVRDNGAGIEPAMLDEVFGLFTQVPQADSRRAGGLGIGLSLVQGLVRLHGGRVEARSAGLQQGSEFIVHLPRLTQGAAVIPPAPGPQEASRPVHGPRRILVVDDNIDAATTVADLLSMSGTEVDVVHDGCAAVDHTSSFRPDIVLLDIGLPDISGYEAARRIRRLQGVRQPRLIALTGWGQKDDKQMAADAGFDQHWTKPVDPQRLLALTSATV